MVGSLTEANNGHNGRHRMAKREGIRHSEAHGIGNPTCPRLLPLKQAAEYLGLTTWAMRERIWAGQIPVVRFPGGRKMYVDRNDIDRFIESHKMVVT